MTPVFADENGSWWHVGIGDGGGDVGPFETQEIAWKEYDKAIEAATA